MTDPLIDLIAPGLQADADAKRFSDSLAQRESERATREAALGRDVDPNYVTSMENFDGLSHAEMYAGAQEMSPAAINEAVGKWGNIATALAFANGMFKQGISSAIEGRWEGEAKDAAAQSVTKFFDSTDIFQRSVYAVADRLIEVGQAASIVKTSVPPPPVFNPIQLLPGLSDVPAMEAHKAAE